MTQDTSRQEVAASRVAAAIAVLRTAVGVGLWTGLIEALSVWGRYALLGRVVFTSDQNLWMTPLLYVLIFLIPGVFLAIVAAVLHPRDTRRPAIGILVAFGMLCLFIPYTQIARWAAAILAVGIGFQAARLAGARPAGFRRAARWSTGGLAILAAAAFAGSQIGGRPSRTTAAADPSAPNIILLVWDTVRAENLSVYGYPEPTTPGLERLAAEGVTFDRAVSPSPWTLPGHSSMFTGRWPHELSASWLQSLDDTYPTVAEALSGHGYATGGFIANHHYTSYDSGLQRGFGRYEDYRVTWRQFLASSWVTQTTMGAELIAARGLGDVFAALRGANFWTNEKRWNDRKHAAETNAELFEWLDEVDDRPFFAFLNYFDAHATYWSPPGYRDRFHAEDPAVRAYDAAIAYQDDQVSALVDELERRGLAENTVIVLTSDHGELFGENGLFGHAHNLYYRTLHVPLLIHAPGRAAAGVRVDDLVSTRDLAATLLDLAGIAPDGDAFPGRSLSRYWRGPAADTTSNAVVAEVDEGRNNAANEPISRGPMASVIEGRLHYILNGDGVEELYDYVADPREEHDLRDDAPADLARLRATLGTVRRPR